MDYKIQQIFVADSTLVTTGDTSTLGTQRVGFYNPSTYQALASASGVTSLIAAFGSGVDQWGSFKTPVIKQANVTGFTGTLAATTVKQQTTYIGFDEIEDSKSPDFGCDQEYVFTFLIREYYSRGIYQPLIRESVRVKTDCCDDCSGNCDSLDCKPFMQEAVDKINAHPLLSKYLTASLVSKCTGTAATTVYALTLPDPGTNVGGVATVKLDTTAATGFTNGTYTGITMTSTSGSGTSATFDFTVAGNVLTEVSVNAAGSGYVIGEVITFAGTKITGGTTPADDFTITVMSTTGAEGVLLDEIKSMYSSYVDDTDTDIVVTADTDGDPDSNSTGNIRIELTPSAGVDLADLPAYNGILWEEITLVASTESCKCGIKVVGKALDEFGTECIPDAVPYVANLVRFKAIVHEGPYNTQDFDLEDACAPWSVTTTQEVQYAVGDGAAMAERERHLFRYNLPNVKEAWYGWNPIYNNDTVLYADPTKEYFVYRLTYLISDPVGFENRTPMEAAVEWWVESTNTTLANSIESFLSTFTGVTVNIA